MEQDETTAAIGSIIRQLSAIDACGSGWAEPDQVRYIRLFIEEGLDELARADEAQFEFMAECAMLAGDNMQDARIGILEERMDNVENPPPEGLAGFLVNLGLMIALELLVVATTTYAIPGLVALAASRLQAKRARQLVSAMAQQREFEKATDVLAALSKAATDRRADFDKISRPSDWASYLTHKNAVRALRQAEKEYSVGLVAFEHSADLALKAQKAMQAASSSVPPPLASAEVKTFMAGALAAQTISRVRANSATSVTQKIIAAAGGATSGGSSTQFQTSTLVGRFLADIRRERNQAAAEWSATRLHIRFLSDADLVTSQVAQDLFFQIHLDPSPTAVQDLFFTDREFLILGIEGALWLSYLRETEALGQGAVTFRPVPPRSRLGDIHGDLFITGFPPDGPSEIAHGISYPGLLQISDKQAEYLYGRFAGSYFTIHPDLAPTFAPGYTATSSSPPPFDPARYQEVPKMPVTVMGFYDRDRLVRVAEMKLLVILFFQMLDTNPDAIGGGDSVGNEARDMLRGLLELTAADDVVGAYLAGLPPMSETGADTGLPVASASQSAPAMEPDRAAQDAATKLASMVTDLDLIITQYPNESYDDSSADLAAKAAADELTQAIQLQQQAVLKQYASVLELAAGSPELTEEVTSGYATRIDALTAWPTPSWQWYGPPTPNGRSSRGTPV